MRIKNMCLLVLLLLVACSPVEESVSAKAPTPTNEQADAEDLQAKILKVSTDLPYDSNWWVVSRDTHRMTIHVEAEHIESVLFWVAPTGTETWKERELIGYDIDGSDGWSLSWEFGNRKFHDHIAVQALGMDGRTLANESINVHTLEE